MEHVQPTCRQKECGHWDDGRCPFSFETWWRPVEGQPKLVRDCAPIRTMIMVQELYNKQVGLQKAIEDQRNEAVKIMDCFKYIGQKITEKQLLEE